MNADESKTKSKKTALPDQESELEALRAELNQARAREQRAVADYQNLQRRTREEQSRWAKLATRDFVSDLLEPLSHLSLAANQLQDPGLEMVVKRLWQTLENQGLQRIEVLGKPFDITTMEAVDQQVQAEAGLDESGEGGIDAEGTSAGVVTQVVREGYLLNGEVIQHAKVIIGSSQGQT
jgi:molecular chaperone GrpE